MKIKKKDKFFIGISKDKIKFPNVMKPHQYFRRESFKAQYTLCGIWWRPWNLLERYENVISNKNRNIL